MMLRLAVISACMAGAMLASGGGGTTAPGSAELRSFSEIAPAGGTVQAKFMLTQPRPISSGGAAFDLSSMDVLGVAASSPLGDTVGAALARDGMLHIWVDSPSSDFGTNLDYPFLTITMRIPQTVPAGSTLSLGLADAQFQSPTGPLTLTDPKPGTLTIGGSLSIDALFPGGGSWPANTVITIKGTGFQPGTKVTTKMKTSPAVYVSPNEIQFTLERPAKLDQQQIKLQNPDGSQVTYYSYLRGVLVQAPAQSLLQSTDPIFPASTQGIVQMGPLPVMADGQFAAAAVQNPNPGPVSVTFARQSTGDISTVVLPPGGRIMDNLAALLGVSVSDGDVITISATAGVQFVGLYGDENTATLTPFLPSF